MMYEKRSGVKTLAGRIAPQSFPDDVHPWLPDAILDLLETSR